MVLILNICILVLLSALHYVSSASIEETTRNLQQHEFSSDSNDEGFSNNSNDECKDDLTFTFDIGDDLEAECSDLGKRVGLIGVPRDRYCSPNFQDNVLNECRASCDLCRCVDNPYFTFPNILVGINDPPNVQCNFLVDDSLTQGERSMRLQTYCNPHDEEKYVGDSCPASCGVCTQTTSTYCANGYQALPPNPKPFRTVPLPIGRSFFLRRTQYRSHRYDACYIEYTETDNGFIVLNTPLADGAFLNYAEVDDNTGLFLDTGISSLRDDPKKTVIRFGPRAGSLIRPKTIEIAKSILEQKEREKSRLLMPKSKDEHQNRHQNRQNHRQSQAVQGAIKNLVIPFRFADTPTVDVTPRGKLNSIFNGSEASVKKFFNLNSFGKAHVVSTVVDWVTLNNAQLTETFCAGFDPSNYMKRDRTQIWRCLRNALDQVKILFDNNRSEVTGLPPGTKFSDFDADHDGKIDSIIFIHAEIDEALGANPLIPRIWSHTWEMDEVWTSSDEGGYVEVGRYSIVSSTDAANTDAANTDAANRRPAPGALAYGLAAFLGAEDLSDIDGNGSGLGIYDTMANPWGVNGDLTQPPQLSAYTKWKLGWIEPTWINGSRFSEEHELRQACTSPDALEITAGLPYGEYLLVENRQPCGLDAAQLPVPLDGEPAGGIAIYHVDERRYGIDASIQGYPKTEGTWPEDGKHYRVALLQADGKYHLERDVRDAVGNHGDTTDLFRAGGVNSIGPDGTSNGDAFPNTDSYQYGIIKESGVTISEIGASAAVMRVVVNVKYSKGGKVVPPSPAPTSNGKKGVPPSNGGKGKGEGKGKGAPGVTAGAQSGLDGSMAAASNSVGLVASVAVVGLVFATIGVAYFIGLRNGRFVRKHHSVSLHDPEYQESEKQDDVIFPVKAFAVVKEDFEVQKKDSGIEISY